MSGYSAGMMFAIGNQYNTAAHVSGAITSIIQSALDYFYTFSQKSH
jgi:hypothetical protein